MKKSVDTVLQALAKQVERQPINSSSPVCYEPLLARDVVSCGNSIAMESEYSYSQAEIETNGKHETNQVLCLLDVCDRHLLNFFRSDSQPKRTKLL